MPIDDALNRGEKIDIHLTLGAEDLRVLDRLADKYRASRGAVISAMIGEYRKNDLSKRIQAPAAGRRKAKTGGGRPRNIRP